MREISPSLLSKLFNLAETKVKTIQDQHTAGPQNIGFDYQFYLFMYLILELKLGQKIGYEAKDDIHIDKTDGSTTLFQAKHTIQKQSDGMSQNLTDLDIDLWKTLSNWADFIKADKEKHDFLEKHSFILVTNKNENNNNFITTLSQFKTDNNIDSVLSILNELKNKTQDKTLTKYIKNVISLRKRKLKRFLLKLSIETNTDEIIQKIKNRIFEKNYQANLVDPIFESLSSNLNETKYLEIKNGQRFELSCEDFSKKFGKCFKVASEIKPLPKRRFDILLPDNLEDQIFIKQLLDIGEVQSGSNYILDYTTQMLIFLRHFTYWSDEENFILLTDVEEFKKNSIQIWTNEFKSKYRQIENQINSGVSLVQLEDKIRILGLDLVDYIRKQDLSIPGFSSLGIEFSNGHYYALSDNLSIGWHFDWKNKYKKE